MDNGVVEKELCANCKKEIPQINYVMHTAHCARNISLCPICKEPIPKGDLAKHRATHSNTPQTSGLRPTKAASTTTTWKSLPKPIYVPEKLGHAREDMKACEYCDLELPGDTLREHEAYCGARTDKCNDCGEIVMFKYRKLHEETNHGFLKLKDEPGPKASWDSQQQAAASSRSSRKPPPPKPVSAFDMTHLSEYLPPSYRHRDAGDVPEYRPSGGLARDPQKVDYKNLSRRLDCKTEYIRNVLHDAACITAPIRSVPTAPRNHFAHTTSRSARRPNPPTELMIPCEFCDTPIPHDDLIQHETGCRPDLVRCRRTSSSSSNHHLPLDDEQRSEIELPCEFCHHLIPASQLLRHQATCA